MAYSQERSIVGRTTGAGREPDREETTEMAYYDEGPWATLGRECECDDCYQASQQPLELAIDADAPLWLTDLLLLEGME